MSLQEGLIGHWTMDDKDTSSGMLYDRSGYNNHGELNGPTTSQASILGEAYDFNGSSDYIQTSLTGNTANNPYSVSLWFNLDSLDSDEIFVGNYNGNGILLRLEEGDEFDFWHDTGSIEGGSVAANEWTHVVYTYDGSGGSIYKNTNEVASGSMPDNTNSSDLRIGDTYDNRYYNGKMADVRIYNRVLTQSEINQLYQMRSQRQQNLGTLINTVVNGKDVILQNDSFGSWICVQNYEHYGGTNPDVSPGDTFPQLPDGDRLISDIDSDAQNGELRHVDNISQYGDWQVNAVRLEAKTSNHSRKINYYSTNQSVIDSIVNDSTTVGHVELKSSIQKYPDHTSFLPDRVEDTNTTGSNPNRIFGNNFPMYGTDPRGDTSNLHWSMGGSGNRWEVDDYPNNDSQTTIHKVWVRTELF